MATPSRRVTNAQALDPEFRESYFGAAEMTAPTLDIHLANAIRVPWFRQRKASPTHSSRAITLATLRTLDLILSCIALTILSPLLLALAVLIKLDSPGPALFPQDRVGKDQACFRMYKLRTMVVDSSTQGLSLTREMDSRVTRIGGFLRKYHMDEIPQFWNVILGNMSIVGPRPEVLELAQLHRDSILGYEKRLELRPGITGLAQITNGYDSCIDERRVTLQLDLHYIRHLSVVNYLKVLLRTVPAVLSCRGVR